MFELFVTIVFVVGMFAIESLVFKIGLIAVYLLLILPGMYSMILGAPFVRTTKRRVDALLDLGNFGSGDVVYDLGCGDGKILAEIAKYRVKKAVGYEFSIPTYFFAEFKKLFLCKKCRKIVDIRFGNFWNQDLSEANKIFIFLFDPAMARFKKEIWPKLIKGTVVISNEFKMHGVVAEKVANSVYKYVK